MSIQSREKVSKNTQTPSASGVVKIAGIQMASGPHVAANLSEAEQLIEIAATQGAKVVALPEYFAIIGPKDTDMLKVREVEGDGALQRLLARTPKQHGIRLIDGSVASRASVANKVRNACLVFDPSGKLAARYHKVHVFG